MIHWSWLLLAFAVGVGVTLLAAFIASLPHPPKCTAVLRSGERCWNDAGHLGPHETRVSVGMISQGYVWEDPKAGVHSVGFFRR